MHEEAVNRVSVDNYIVGYYVSNWDDERVSAAVSQSVSQCSSGNNTYYIIFDTNNSCTLDDQMHGMQYHTGHRYFRGSIKTEMQYHYSHNHINSSRSIGL